MGGWFRYFSQVCTGQRPDCKERDCQGKKYR